MNHNLFPWLKHLKALVSVSAVLSLQCTLYSQLQPRSDEADEAIITLSPFEVADSKGKGYVSATAMSGLKSNTLIIDIPQSVVVITRDIIEDSGQFASVADILQYVASGTMSYSRVGDFQMQRGFRTGYVLLDGQIDLAQYSDTVMVDSYEVVKGPTAVLYGARTGLAGVIVKHSRKPLSYNAHSVRATVGEGNFLRGEFDLGGPIGTIGNANVSYRAYGATQKYDGFQRVDHDDRLAFGGGLKFELTSKTNLLVQGDYFNNNALPIRNDFDNETGTGTYTGPGSDLGYVARWANSEITRLWGKATLNHRFGENWAMVGTIVVNDLTRDDEGVYNRSFNWPTGILNQSYSGWKFNQHLVAAQIDVNGEYELFGMKQRSTFGFSSERTRTDQRNWSVPTLSTSIVNPNTYDVPKYAFPEPGTVDPTRVGRQENFAYYMHTLHITPESLSLVLGYQAAQVTNLNVNKITNAATEVPTQGNPYRLGAVYKPQQIKGLAFFVNKSTMFQGGGFGGEFGPLPPQVGSVEEIGFKTDMLDSRISATVAVFDLTVSNVPIPFTNPVTGRTFSIAAGTQRNKGFEIDLALRPTESWTIMGTLYSGNIIGVTGVRQANTINDTYSFLTRYDFTPSSFGRFYVGASMFGRGDRSGGAWPSYKVYNALFGYTHGNLTIAANIENLADEVYANGWARHFHDIGRPRNTKVTFSYRF